MFYRNERVDALMDDAERTFDATRQIQLCREAERLIVADAPWFFWNYNKAALVHQPNVHGIAGNPLDLDWLQMRKVWIQPRRGIDGHTRVHRPAAPAAGAGLRGSHRGDVCADADRPGRPGGAADGRESRISRPGRGTHHTREVGAGRSGPPPVSEVPPQRRPGR